MLHADGIERRALREKQFGVFDCRLAADHPMTRDTVRSRSAVPHSRYNDLPERALTAAATRSSPARLPPASTLFAKQDGSFFLFFQGHPEYEADTLLREYRRDVARFLAGERERLSGAAASAISMTRRRPRSEAFRSARTAPTGAAI